MDAEGHATFQFEQVREEPAISTAVQPLSNADNDRAEHEQNERRGD